MLVFVNHIHNLGNPLEKKLHTYARINKINASITENKNLEAAIKLHCDSIFHEFRQRKLFYKFIFSNNRFIISTITASVFYSREEAYFSDVTHECLKTGLVSPNTVSSLLTLFKVSGRISVVASQRDLRKKKYLMTKKGTNDILVLLNTMTPSLQLLFSEPECSVLLNDRKLPEFFQQYSKIHDSSIFIVNLVKDIEVFISKDSGHMILVTLYLLGLNNKSTNETLSSIAKTCGVSRTHLRNIVTEAESRRLLCFDREKNKVYMHNGFLDMFRNYMSFYFSFIKFGLEGIG